MAVQVAVRLPDVETRELFKRCLSIEGETIQSFLHRKIMDRVELQRRREAEGRIDFREVRGILGGSTALAAGVTWLTENSDCTICP